MAIGSTDCCERDQCDLRGRSSHRVRLWQQRNINAFTSDGRRCEFQAVIGGAVYRGSAIPALRGTYFFTDLYGNTRTFRYDVASDTLSEVVSLESDLNPAENDQGLVASQNGGDGELYFVSRGSSGGGGAFAPQNAIGVIYRLEAE